MPALRALEHDRMQSFLPIALLLLFAVGGLALALRLLWPGAWLLGWLRGCAGVLLLTLGLWSGLLAMTLASYARAPQSGAWLEVAVSAADEGFSVTLDGALQRTLQLHGELWQLRARVWRWGPLASYFGLQPGFRPEVLAARYLAFEAQGQGSREALQSDWFGLDPGRRLENAPSSDWARTQLLRGPWLPLRDGAKYAVVLTPVGLLVQPANDVALRAMEAWR